jgi:hypothetical protein
VEPRRSPTEFVSPDGLVSLSTDRTDLWVPRTPSGASGRWGSSAQRTQGSAVSHDAPTDPFCRYRRIGVGPYAGRVRQFGHLGTLDGDFFGSIGRRRVTVMG